MKNKYKGINTILMLSILCLSVGSVYAQAGPTGIGTRNPQGPLHVDGAKDNATTGAPTTAQAANDVIVTKATGFIGVGVLAPAVPLDMRSPSSTNTENALGLGTTNLSAAAAAVGAMRYDAASPAGTGPAIDVSGLVSGVPAWKRVYVAPQKAVVVERIISTQSIAPAGTTIGNWNEVKDTTGSFEQTTGIFTAPHDATYTFLLTFDFVGTPITDGSRVESQFYNTTTNAVLASVYKTFGQSMTGTADDANQTRPTQAGGSSTVTLTLTTGTKVATRLLHTLTGFAINLRVTGDASDPANPNDGFNNLTIIEH